MKRSALNVLDFRSPRSFTSGVQEAIDALPASGGTVHLPAGKYLLRRRVIMRKNVLLRGEGPATVLTRPRQFLIPLKRKTGKRPSRFELISTREIRPGEEWYLRDEKNYSYGAVHGIVKELKGRTVIWNLLDSRLECAYVPGPHAFAANWFPALWAEMTERIAIENLSIEGGIRKHARPRGDFTCAAIHTRGVGDVRIEKVWVRNWPGDGISVQGAGGGKPVGCALVTGCLVEYCCGYGLHPGTSLRSSIWTNNIARRCTLDGFFFCLNVNNATVQGNLLLENARHGIGSLCYPDRFNTVIGNVCAGNGRHGIDASGAFGNVIQGNICRNNSRAQPGAYAAIYLQDHRDNIVKDNLCVDDQESPTQLRGVVSVNPAGQNAIADNPLVSAGALAKRVYREQ